MRESSAPSVLRLTLYGAGLALLFGGLPLAGFLMQAGRIRTQRSVLFELFSHPTALWLHIPWFLLSLFFLYALLVVCVSVSSRRLIYRFASTARVERLAHILLILATLFFVTLLNGWLYPHSIWGLRNGDDTPTLLWMLSIVALALFIAVPVAYGVFSFGRQYLTHLKSSRTLQTATGLVLLVPAIGVVFAAVTPDPPRQTFPERPHIVIVGVDGWRLDTAPLTGKPAELMPFMDSLFAEAAVIQETFTPMARSYPAWMSILTGQNPSGHGARFNLIPDNALRHGPMLSEMLSDLGYYSMIAMDERRFADIDERHGFDKIIGPPGGAADFLLGNLNDTPLTNLTSSTPLGALLFPFTHGNRAAYATYRPSTFDRQLERAIRTSPDKPLFLIAHYELPHWPYIWAYTPVAQNTHLDVSQWPHLYHKTLNRADNQINVLFRILEQEGILDNSIIVLLSDHGEAFPNIDETWEHALGEGSITPLHGHGTHVLSLSQSLVPLAFLRSDGVHLEAGLRPVRASLTDILPTIADMLGLPTDASFDGTSLHEVLMNPPDDRTTIDPVVSLETGFHLYALADLDLNEMALFDEAGAFYRIQPNGALVLREEVLPRLLRSKQRGVLRGDWLLASLPEGIEDGEERVVVAHLPTRTFLEWSEAMELVPEAVELQREFCGRFRVDMRVAPSLLCPVERAVLD